MGVVRYSKLVRDNIPQIIARQGKQATTRRLGEAEYEVKLKEKLMEEVGEFLAAASVEELADIQEVVLALSASMNISRAELENVRLEKRSRNGGFEKRLLLEEVRTEPDD